MPREMGPLSDEQREYIRHAAEREEVRRGLMALAVAEGGTLADSGGGSMGVSLMGDNRDQVATRMVTQLRKLALVEGETHSERAAPLELPRPGHEQQVGRNVMLSKDRFGAALTLALETEEPLIQVAKRLYAAAELRKQSGQDRARG